jgi:hypothetical protein
MGAQCRQSRSTDLGRHYFTTHKQLKISTQRKLNLNENHQNSKANAVDVVAPSGGPTSGVGCLIGVAATTVVAGANAVLWTRGAFTHA